MGCGFSRFNNKNNSSSNNTKTNTRIVLHKVLSIKVTGSTNHHKGLYRVSEVSASQEFSRGNSSLDSMKLHISNLDLKNITG